MSSIVIKGNTSGQIELAAPDVAGSTTLTLPTGSGTVITDTAPKAGSVIQVVYATHGSATGNNTADFIDSGLEATITPSSTSSKIIIIATHGDAASQVVQSGIQTQLIRNGTVIPTGKKFTNNVNYGPLQNGYDIHSSPTIHYVDSPATTSAVTYKTQLRAINGASGLVTFFRDNTVGTMTLMEIAG